MLERIKSTDFAAYLNQTFYLDVGAPGTDRLALDLVEVKELGPEPDQEGQRRAFSIVFAGPIQPVLPQRIYQVTHEAMGTLALFLVPLGPDRSNRIRYEAVFT